MKKTMILLLVSLASMTAFAGQGGDQEQLYYDCELAQPLPTGNFTVKLYEGGLTGKARIETTLNRLGNNDVKNYFVARKSGGIGRIGAARVYQGEHASFSINLTTGVLKDGRRTATLVTDDTGRQDIRQLLCELPQ
jgi:hypothetical protein